MNQKKFPKILNIQTQHYDCCTWHGIGQNKQKIWGKIVNILFILFLCKEKRRRNQQKTKKILKNLPFMIRVHFLRAR